MALLPASGPAQESLEPQPPSLRIDLGKSQITMTGDASSAAHLTLLQQLAAEISPELPLKDEMQVRMSLPPGWALVTEMTLRAVGQTYEATATVEPKRVTVRGFAADGTAWQAAAGRLQENLLPDMLFHSYVSELIPADSFGEQCLNLLQAVTSRRRVRFSQAGGELNSNAYALLDELIEIAADCPAIRISVTGHTDGSGDPELNNLLSKARADAVTAYMVGQGLAADRFETFGAGSSAPLVTETNARTRARNRRIQFTFSLAANM